MEIVVVLKQDEVVEVEVEVEVGVVIVVFGPDVILE